MKKFSDYHIKAPEANFTGDKIKIEKILNTKIEVHDYKIEKSNFHGDRLVLQIEHKGEKRIIFSGSNTLIEMIKEVPHGEAFETTIIKNDSDRYQFS